MLYFKKDLKPLYKNLNLFILIIILIVILKDILIMILIDILVDILINILIDILIDHFDEYFRILVIIKSITYFNYDYLNYIIIKL